MVWCIKCLVCRMIIYLIDNSHVSLLCRIIPLIRFEYKKRMIQKRSGQEGLEVIGGVAFYITVIKKLIFFRAADCPDESALQLCEAIALSDPAVKQDSTARRHICRRKVVAACRAFNILQI